MKIIVTSDNHGNEEVLDYLLETYADADLFIHCGDICLPPDKYPRFKTVKGNNDFYDYPEELVLDVEGIKILVMHSDVFGYYHREYKLVKKAQSEDCQIFCFGHTHVPMIQEDDGVVLFNPGSMVRPRGGSNPSYGIITIDDNKEIKFEIKEYQK